MSTPSNPPAFPTTAGISGYGLTIPHTLPSGDIVWEGREQGMTMRDYFAAKAMAALLTTEFIQTAVNNALLEAGLEAAAAGIVADLSSQSYDLADAMLAERERK